VVHALIVRYVDRFINSGSGTRLNAERSLTRLAADSVEAEV
jgi:hypothetical protein